MGPLFVWCDRCAAMFLADRYWVFKFTDWLQMAGWSSMAALQLRRQLLERVAVWEHEPIHIIRYEVKPSGHLMVYWTTQPVSVWDKVSVRWPWLVAAAVIAVMAAVLTLTTVG